MISREGVVESEYPAFAYACTAVNVAAGDFGLLPGPNSCNDVL